MSVHGRYSRLPAPKTPDIRGPRPDVPVLTFVGAWLLVLSWDIGGLTGLLFPGLIRWVLWIVALLRATIRRRPAAAERNPRDARLMRLLWLGCALTFGVIAGGELFVSRLMPDAWRQTLVKTFHIRRVYRNYGP
jgi:hypothetical protein